MTTQKIYSPQEAQARLASLPPEARDYIYSQPMYEALKAVAIKHKLHIDQLALLEAETSAVMLGFTEPQDFTPLLQENLHLDPAQAALVSEDVNAMVLQKVRGVMKTATPSSKPPGAPVAPAPSRTIMPTVPASAPGDSLRPATPVRPPITSVTRSAPAAPGITPRPPQPAPQIPTLQKPAAPVPQKPSASAAPAVPMMPKTVPPPPNLPGVPSAPRTVLTAPAAAPPADPLRRVNEKLSAPSLSATKTFDLSLGGQAPKPPAPSPAAPESAVKKPYTKDPYREPIE